MSISSETSEVDFAGNASTVTPYAIPFRFDDSAWLDVSTVASDGTVTALTLGAGDFTVGGDGSTATGTLTTTVAVPATTTLRIRRITPRTSTQDLEFTGTIPAEVTEANLDKGRMIDQDHERRRAELEERSLRVPDGETLAQLAAAASRAELVVCFDENGAVELLSKSAVLAAGGGAPTGVGIPDGGSADQVLAKLSTTDQDVKWDDVGDLDFTLPNGTAARSMDDRLGERMSVAEFGTIDPTGVADSQAAFQAAIDYGINNRVRIEVPPGTYLFTSFATGTTHLQSDPGTYSPTKTHKLELVGLGRVVLKSTANASTMLQLVGNHIDPIIENIQFLCERATYGATDTVAIKATGGGSHAIIGAKIVNCTFDGWRQSIHLAGSREWLITGCRFRAWQGRDAGYTSGNWVAHIAAYMPSDGGGGDNGRNINHKVIGNHFSGYTGVNGIGTDAPNTGDGMENAMIGKFDGLLVACNIFENFDYEAILCGFWPAGIAQPKTNPVLIQTNIFHCAQPSGDVDNWGVRCDVANATISGNFFYDAATAILVQTQEDPHYDLEISENHIELNNSGEPYRAITVASDSTERLKNPRILRNNIIGRYTTAYTTSHGIIGIFRCDDFVARDNTIQLVGFTSDDPTVKIYGFDIGNCNGGRLSGNIVAGPDYFMENGGSNSGTIHVFSNDWETVVGFSDSVLSSAFQTRAPLVDNTFTAGGTTGVQTINKSAGSINFAASDASKLVNNSLVTTSSIILATVATNDLTMTSVQAVPSSGGITFHANAAATAETRVNFWVIN